MRGIILNPWIDRGYTFHKPNEQSNQLPQIMCLVDQREMENVPLIFA
jgi:hypothetical protein